MAQSDIINLLHTFRSQLRQFTEKLDSVLAALRGSASDEDGVLSRLQSQIRDLQMRLDRYSNRPLMLEQMNGRLTEDNKLLKDQLAQFQSRNMKDLAEKRRRVTKVRIVADGDGDGDSESSVDFEDTVDFVNAS